MPLPSYVAGLLPNVRVAYRGSAEPQELFIDLRLSEPDPHGLPAIRVRDLVSAINAGAAGGSHFAPGAGSAKLLEGPRPSLDPAEWHPGPEYRWVIEVRGVSPLFLRSVVEWLMIAADPIAPASLSIYGSLHPDATELSVHDRQLQPWSAGTATYPQRWPSLPFALAEETVPRGLALRVAFADDIDPDGVEKLNEALGLWALLSTTYPSLARDGVGYRSFADRLGVHHREYSRFVEELDIAQDVLTTTLLHVLARFSADVAKIEHVDVRMP
ncbi:MAG: hypothetical protein R3B70_39030 [Polyangiaceae bacterium]